MIIDEKIFKEQINEFKTLLEKMAVGIPDRVAALKNVSATDAELINEATNRVSNILSDIDKETSKFKK